MDRLDFAISLAQSAGDLGLKYFRSIADLKITSKGHQDAVSDADLAVERHVRAAIGEAFPDDGLLGEEYGVETGKSGYTWVIDPIDGTMNFINSIPVWAVVIACVREPETVIGVIHDPNANETFSAQHGKGAFLNGRPISASAETDLTKGTVAVGISNRSNPACATRIVDGLMQRGSLFHRNASGAIGLAYVAAGRFLGYCEPHMNPWDCVAGLLLISEAGGRTYDSDLSTMLDRGDQVIAAGAGVYDEVLDLATHAFTLDANRT
ncbi:MAG: inositol monophosphatase family protein [Hyphomicrobiaceae bacterium]